MKSNYKIGDIITSVDNRNYDLCCNNLKGLSMTKEFRPSTSNIVGTDLSRYKIVAPRQFAVDFMSTIRVHRMPIALNESSENILVSPAYAVFKVIDENIILTEYLMMWFSRPEFDRYADFRSDAAIRGGYGWNELCDTDIYVPPIEEQRKIVKAYKAITDRITLKKRINDNLEATLTAVFTEIFSAAEATEQTKLSELMTFGNGKSRPKTDGTIPVYGGNGILSYTDQYNIENAILIGRVGAYCGSVYLEQGICWVSDNAIFAKSKVSIDEFFDYFLLKKLNLFNHHVGTGQQLLTQEILNNIEVAKPNIEQIEIFNAKAKAVFQSISANRDEIIRLQELSDLLLSRLAG